MPELHSTECACQDCRNRRLIREDDVAAERSSVVEPEDYGYGSGSRWFRNATEDGNAG